MVITCSRYKNQNGGCFVWISCLQHFLLISCSLPSFPGASIPIYLSKCICKLAQTPQANIMLKCVPCYDSSRYSVWYRPTLTSQPVAARQSNPSMSGFCSLALSPKTCPRPICPTGGCRYSNRGSVGTVGARGHGHTVGGLIEGKRLARMFCC